MIAVCAHNDAHLPRAKQCEGSNTSGITQCLNRQHNARSQRGGALQSPQLTRAHTRSHSRSHTLNLSGTLVPHGEGQSVARSGPHLGLRASRNLVHRAAPSHHLLVPSPRSTRTPQLASLILAPQHPNPGPGPGNGFVLAYDRERRRSAAFWLQLPKAASSAR